MVRSDVEVKSWGARGPSVDELRPAWCPNCKKASRPSGGRIRLQGHGLRERQVWGPPEPKAQAAIRVVRVRRYRCVDCWAVTTVAPAETLSRRLYSASAIVWALALFGLGMLSPARVREQVSPWRVVGAASQGRWRALQRWCRAAQQGGLFAGLSNVPAQWGPRRVAERVSAYSAAHALPMPEPPPLAELAFFGALRAR